MWHIYVFDNNSTTNDNDSTYFRRQSLVKVLKDLNRIDISIVENRNIFDTSKISDTNKIICNSIEYFSLSEPFILFIHINNACFFEFLKNILEQNLQCWVVCYSGGDETKSCKELIRIFSSKKNVSFFPNIGAIITLEELNQKWNIKTFIDAVVKDKQNPFDYLARKIPSHLIALSILCQGFLAAHGKKDNLHEWVSVWENLSNDLKDGDYQLGTKSKTEGRGWWEPALGNNYRGEKLENELLDSKKSDKIINELTAFIRENKNEMLITDIQQRENFTNLVNEAYKNITEILKGSGFINETVSN